MNQKSLDKNKPKELDCWKNELRKIQSPSGIYFIDELGQLEVVAIENFIKQILTQQRTELLEEINKLLIGELVIVKTREPYYYQNKRSIPKEQYEFLLEQRQKLINLLNKKDE